MNIEIFENNIINAVALINELKNYSNVSAIGSVVKSSMAIASGYFNCLNITFQNYIFLKVEK